jgi:hypothetical protein
MRIVYILTSDPRQGESLCFTGGKDGEVTEATQRSRQLLPLVITEIPIQRAAKAGGRVELNSACQQEVAGKDRP